MYRRRHINYSNTLQQDIVQHMQCILADLAWLGHRLQLLQQVQAQGPAPEGRVHVVGNDLAAQHRHLWVLVAPLEVHLQQLVEPHHLLQLDQIRLQEILELVPLAQIKHNGPLATVQVAWTVRGRARIDVLEHLFESPAGVRRLLKLHGAPLVRVEVTRGQGGRQHPLGEGRVDGQNRLVCLALAGWLAVGGRDEREDNIGGLAIKVKSGHQLHHGVDGLAQHGHVLVPQDLGGVQRLEGVVERDDHYERESSVLVDVGVVQVNYLIPGFDSK